MKEPIPFQAARTAIYQRLSADLSIPVYPFAAPQGSEFPYVVLRRLVCENPETKASVATQVSVTLEVYDDYEGSDAVMQAQNAIMNSLTREALSFPTGYMEVYGMSNLNRAEHEARWDGSKEFILGTVEFSFFMQEV